MDKRYSCIVELVTLEQILAANLQIYPACFPEYMHKWKEAKQKKNLQSKDIRFQFCLIEIFSSDIRKQ